LAVTQTLIKEEIDESDYITIQNDETTDNANISQLVFIVRYVKNARINERFMGFIRPSGHSAEYVILKELEHVYSLLCSSIELNFRKSCTSK
jgi:hypothetical protein